LISDALAWLGFYALLLWLLSVLIGLSGYWSIVDQIAAFIGLIEDCEGQHCSIQMSLDDTPTAPYLFGFEVSFVRELQFPLFATWMGIALFQSFFVGRFRIWPWQSLNTL
jgi:hypothetical protein